MREQPGRLQKIALDSSEMLEHNTQGEEQLGVCIDGMGPVKKALSVPESAKVLTYNHQIFF